MPHHDHTSLGTPSLPPLTCDVCGATPALGVCCSSLGAVSFAYCRDCNACGAEPYAIAVGVVAMAGETSLEGFAPWFHWMLFATLLRASKTAAEFWADVAKEIDRGLAEDAAHAAKVPS